MATALQFLQALTAPRFRAGHTLLPLTDWLTLTPGLDRDAGVARLAWGYAINCSVEPATNLNNLANPIRQNLDYAAAHPDVPVQANLYRPLGYASYQATLPASAWCTSPTTGDREFSPVAPQSVLDAAGAATAAQIARITALGVTPSILIHGAETGLKSYNGMGSTLNDPTVLAWLNREGESIYTDRTQAPGTLWARILSEAKARENAPQVDLAMQQAPGAPCVYYTSMDPWEGLNSTKWSDAFNWRYLRRVTNYAGPELYYGNNQQDTHPNGEWVWGKYSYAADLLTLATNCIGQALRTGQSLMYPFVSGGWDTSNPVYISDDQRWEGFLKALYTLGCLGVCYGYFKTDGTVYTGDLGANKPVWLRHMLIVGKVHARMSYLEEYLRGGDLLEGDLGAHNFGDNQPAYEFAAYTPGTTTRDTTVRVVARKLRGQRKYLACAWVSSGANRDVVVTLPDVGTVTLFARTTGSLVRYAYVDGAWARTISG